MLESDSSSMPSPGNETLLPILSTDLLNGEGIEPLTSFANTVINKALGADSKQITLDPKELAKVALDSNLNSRTLRRASLSAIGAIFADLGVWALESEDRETTGFVPGSHGRQIGYVGRQIKSVSIGPVKKTSILAHDWELKSVIKPDQKYLLRVELEDDPYANGAGLIGNGNGNLSTGSFRIFQYQDSDKSGQPSLAFDIHKDKTDSQKKEPGVDYARYQGKPGFLPAKRTLVPRRANLRIDNDSQVFLSLNKPSGSSIEHTFDLAIMPLSAGGFGTNNLVGQPSGLMPKVGFSVLDSNDRPVKNTYGNHSVGVKQIPGSPDCQKFRAIHFDNGKKHSATVSFPRLPSHLPLATEDNLGEAIDGLENYARLLEVLFTVESR